MTKTFVDDIDELRKIVGVNPTLSNHIDEVLGLIAHNRALLKGHFSLQSGRHSAFFFRFRHIGQDRVASDAVAKWLLEAHRQSLPADVVLLAPESAGFYLAGALERTIGLPVAHATAKIDYRRRPTLELRSGKIVSQQPVVILEDAITSGTSLRTLIQLAEKECGVVKAAFVFAALDPAAFTRVLNDYRIPGQWLVQALWSTWSPEDCELCGSGDTAVVPAFELN